MSRATMTRTCSASALLGGLVLWVGNACAQNVAAPAACADLSKTALENTSITLAQSNPPSEKPLAPAHCEIIGKINERVGIDGKAYAIQFHLRLPEKWNGRFFFQGGGGMDGVLGEGLGNIGIGQIENALSRGYAAVTTDSGHKIEDVPYIGAALWGLDPQARIDYGYNALDLVTRTSKKIIALHYGTGPKYSYFIGCSNGGRQAFMASQRFPEHFDGIVAGAPGFNAPLGAVNQLWYLQAWASAATELDARGQPYLATALSEADQVVIGDAVLAKCDDLDGLKDGIIDNVEACRFDPAVLECKEGASGQCLRPAQVNALKRAMAGPHNSKGERIASDWAYDAGINSPGWRGRAFGTLNAQKRNDSSALFLGTEIVAYAFSTPPFTPGLNVADPEMAAKEVVQFALDYNFDTGPSYMYARNETYKESAIEYDAATSTDLSKFKGLGHKLIVYHGASDPSWSMNDTLGWYKKLLKVDEKARDFARFYIVPGLNHCSMGPSTEGIDFLTPIVNWVEKDVAPEEIIGTARSKSVNPAVPWPGRTRPICPYPLQSRYKGKGSIEMAENFACREAN